MTPDNSSNQDKKRSDRKRSRPVQVVTCPSSFPIFSSKKRKRPPTTAAEKKKPPPSLERNKKKEHFLDWHETAREVHALGATAFVGEQKRNYQDEQYQQLTGRQPKKQQVPLPIVRGIKKKAAQRQARMLQEAKEAGRVLPKQQQQQQRSKQQVRKRQQRRRENDNNKMSRVHGPAPSIGFLHKGVLRVKGKPK